MRDGSTMNTTAKLTESESWPHIALVREDLA